MHIPILRRSASWLALGALLVFGMACQKADTASMDDAGDAGSTASMDDPMDHAGHGAWQVLFDGSSLDHWRGYQQDSVPSGWTVTDGGDLSFDSDGEGGDLITREQYGDFELELEWKISEGGNSGIIYRATEDHDAPWRTGPEMQVLDDAAFEGEITPKTVSGSNYDMHAPSENVVKPAGEWNHVRIVAHGPHIEHWLNGTKVVEYELWSDDWKARIAESKWVDMPDYGMKKEGHIVLQDHGNPVWFRNVRIRKM